MTSALARLAGVVGAIAVSAAALPVSHAREGSAAVNAFLSPDSISGLAGYLDTMSLVVDLGATGKALGSYDVTISWDSTVARLDSVRAGTFGALGQGNVNFVNGGQLRLAQVNANGVGGQVTLAHLFFRVVGTTTGARTTIVPAFSELTSAGDFANLLADFASQPGVARVAPSTTLVGFTPDSLFERVGFHPAFGLVVDMTGPMRSLGSYAAIVTWDSAVMRLDSVQAIAFANPDTNVVNAGELRLAAAEATGFAGSGEVARLHFRFLGDTWPKQSSLDVVVTEMAAARTFENLLPGVVIDAGTAVIGGVLRGDVDISGGIAALDAQVILQGVVGLALPAGAKALPNGDADCGGTLQARDAQIVLNRVVGNDVSTFCVGKIQ